jgi:hypothetical protein
MGPNPLSAAVGTELEVAAAEVELEVAAAEVDLEVDPPSPHQ